MDDKIEKEKLSKYPHVRIGTAICTFVAIVILVLAAVASFDVGAIEPPSLDGYQVYYVRPDDAIMEDALLCLNRQLSVGGYNVYRPLVVFFFGNSMTCLLVDEKYNPSITYDEVNNVFTTSYSTTYCRSTRLSDKGWVQVDNITAVMSISQDDVYAYWDDGGLVLNDFWESGSFTNSVVFQTAFDSWELYYDKVINFDTYIQNSVNAGFAQGELAGLTQGRQEGYETGYDDGYRDGESDGYEQGYVNGNVSGLTQGRQEGYETGYDDGYDDGFVDGYETGYDDGIADGEVSTTIVEITENIDVGSIISALPEGAKAIINGALDWEIFGINVAGTLTAILVVAIVGFVVKWLLSLKS